MLRISHKGGEKADRGNYWNFSNGERVSLSSEGALPGDASVTYYKVNPVVVLAAGPALGLLYAAFLPFIGLAIVIKLIVSKIFGKSVDEASRVATFNWRPTEAYLAGKRRKKNSNSSTDSKPDNEKKS